MAVHVVKQVILLQQRLKRLLCEDKDGLCCCSLEVLPHADLCSRHRAVGRSWPTYCMETYLVWLLHLQPQACREVTAMQTLRADGHPSHACSEWWHQCVSAGRIHVTWLCLPGGHHGVHVQAGAAAAKV